MKQGIWSSDWFVGLLIALAFIFGSYAFDFIDGIERSAYDFGVKQSSRVASDKLAIIAIDDQSIANIGRWPWPRNVHAQMHATTTSPNDKQGQEDDNSTLISNLRSVLDANRNREEQGPGARGGDNDDLAWHMNLQMNLMEQGQILNDHMKWWMVLDSASSCSLFGNNVLVGSV